MVPRKRRTNAVLDTNVFVRAFKTRQNKNANRFVVRLWLVEKKLQLIVSDELIDEYLEIFSDVLAMDQQTVSQWETRFREDSRSTHVNLGRRFTQSRDPDDNVLLATATAGGAAFLITNDRDLLELPPKFQRTQPYKILTPQAFIAEWEANA
jgi:putative PIN family toxin of toxin-antitoxin system